MKFYLLSTLALMALVQSADLRVLSKTLSPNEGREFIEDTCGGESWEPVWSCSKTRPTWFKTNSERIVKSLRSNPEFAKQKSICVNCIFKVDSNGAVADIFIYSSDSSKALNKVVISQILAAAPFAQPPQEVLQKHLLIRTITSNNILLMVDEKQYASPAAQEMFFKSQKNMAKLNGFAEAVKAARIRHLCKNSTPSSFSTIDLR